MKENINIIKNKEIEIKNLKKILHEKKQELKNRERKREKDNKRTKENMTISSIILALSLLLFCIFGPIKIVTHAVKYSLAYIILAVIGSCCVNKFKKIKESKIKKNIAEIRNDLLDKKEELELLKSNSLLIENQEKTEQENLKYSYTQKHKEINNTMNNDNSLTLKKVQNKNANK